MIHRDDRTEITKSDSGREPEANHRRAIVWIVVAFDLLIVGLVGGTIVHAWRGDWAWVLPLVCFVAYMLAFRHGMLLWNPQVDRTWRQYVWIEPIDGRGDGPTVNGPEESSGSPENLRIVRPETSHPPRHELRVVQ